MAPGVQIPVVAVSGEALGGDGPLGGGAAAAGAIVDVQAVAEQHGLSEDAETMGLQGPGPDGDEPDPLCQGVGVGPATG